MTNYIFMDESGDLGFSKKSSQWFMFTLAITNDKRSLERVTKKVWKPLKQKHKKLGELHAYHADGVTRTRMLQKLSEINDLRILCIILNKEKVYIDLQNQKNYLYNYTANILLERLHKKGVIDGGNVELHIDRKDTKKSITENFLNYLENSMTKRGSDMKVTMHTSHENKSIQAVDFLSWAIFRKYELGDFEYYELIKEKIIDERLLFA